MLFTFLISGQIVFIGILQSESKREMYLSVVLLSAVMQKDVIKSL